MLKSVFNFFNTGGLLKDSTILFAGMASAHILNLLFQVVMGRSLSGDEFALLTALLGMYRVFVVPLGVVSSTVNRYSSLLVQEGRRGDVRRLVLYWLKFVLVPGGIFSLCCFCFPDRVARFIHVERMAPVFIFGVVLMGAFVRPVFDGAMLGLQGFKGWSFSSAVGWGARLIIGGLLVLRVSPHAGWGLLGHGIGFYMAIFLGAFFVFSLLSGERTTKKPLPGMHGYLFGSFFILLGFSVLLTGDVVLVKHLFPKASGDFAYAATLGRLIIFVPQALVSSMFPKVVAEKGASREQHAIFIKTLFLTFITTVVAASLFSFLVEFLLWFIYGISYPSAEMLKWSRGLTWIMVPVSLLSVTVRYALAQRKLRSVAIVPLGAVCYVSLNFGWGCGVEWLLLALLACTLFSLLFSLWHVCRFVPSSCHDEH